MGTLTTNRRASFDYEILKTLEAGVALFGFEARAVRQGRIDLVGSYVIIRNGEAWLLNAKIHPLQPKNVPPGYDVTRSRKLLLKKKELQNLAGKVSGKRLTLVPLRVYTRGRYLKLEFALARGKKSYEKRELLKKKTMAREVERFLKE